MDMASLATFVSLSLISHLCNHGQETRLTVLPLVFVAVSLIDERVIDITRFDGIEQVEEKHSIAQ
jgi:hypothetical protein